MLLCRSTQTWYTTMLGAFCSLHPMSAMLIHNVCHVLHDCIIVCDVAASGNNVMSVYVTLFDRRLQGTLILLLA